MHPGDFLASRFLHPGGISQEKLAHALGISRRRVNELVCGKRAITPDTAVRLAHFFGTDVAFWLQLQFAWDLHQARRLYYEKAHAERAGSDDARPDGEQRKAQRVRARLAEP